MSTRAPILLVADQKGKIFEHPALEAAGMKAGRFFRLDPKELIKLPAGSQLFKLPDRSPVGYDPQTATTLMTKMILYADPGPKPATQPAALPASGPSKSVTK